MNVKLLAAIAVVTCAVPMLETYRRSQVAPPVAPVRRVPEYVYPVYKEHLIPETPASMQPHGPFAGLPARDSAESVEESAANGFLRAALLASGDDKKRLLADLVKRYPQATAAKRAIAELGK